MQTSRRYRLSGRRQGADGGLPFPVCYENHAQDSRIRLMGHHSPQLNAKAGTGGNNLPLILQIVGVDGQNCCITGHVAMSVTGQRIDLHCVPGVLSVWHTEHSVTRPDIKLSKHEEPSA